MRDPYDVLGVQRTADAAAIKSAFRKLAKKHHPDANKSDPKSAQRFAELNTAYEILGDDAKRKAFDRRRDRRRRQASDFQGFRAQPGGGGHAELPRKTIFPGGFARGGRAAGGLGGFEELPQGHVRRRGRPPKRIR